LEDKSTFYRTVTNQNGPEDFSHWFDDVGEDVHSNNNSRAIILPMRGGKKKPFG